MQAHFKNRKIANARNLFNKNLISKEELTKIEDEEIALLVEAEKKNGLKAVTDGEFRRAYWHLDFLAGLDGIEHIGAKNWSTHFEGVQPKAETVRIAGKVGFSESHPLLKLLTELRRLLVILQLNTLFHHLQCYTKSAL